MPMPRITAQDASDTEMLFKDSLPTPAPRPRQDEDEIRRLLPPRSSSSRRQDPRATAIRQPGHSWPFANVSTTQRAPVGLDAHLPHRKVPGSDFRPQNSLARAKTLPKQHFNLFVPRQSSITPQRAIVTAAVVQPPGPIDPLNDLNANDQFRRAKRRKVDHRVTRQHSDDELAAISDVHEVYKATSHSKEEMAAAALRGQSSSKRSEKIDILNSLGPEPINLPVSQNIPPDDGPPPQGLSPDKHTNPVDIARSLRRAFQSNSNQSMPGTPSNASPVFSRARTSSSTAKPSVGASEANVKSSSTLQPSKSAPQPALDGDQTISRPKGPGEQPSKKRTSEPQSDDILLTAPAKSESQVLKSNTRHGEMFTVVRHDPTRANDLTMMSLRQAILYDIHFHGKNLQLGYDAAGKIFQLVAPGEPQVPIFNATKINRVKYAEPIPDVFIARVFLARIGNQDHIVDLEFNSRQQYVKFMAMIRSFSTVRYEGQPAQKMQSILSRRTQNLQMQNDWHELQRMTSLSMKGHRSEHEARSTKSVVPQDSKTIRVVEQESDLHRQQRSPDNVHPIPKQKRSHESMGERSQYFDKTTLPTLDRSEPLHRLLSARSADLTSSNLLTRSTRSLSRQVENMASVTVNGQAKDACESEMRQPRGEPWKYPLVYPQYGKRKVTVEFEDLERLDGEQFLNDNLIGFYLRYLAEQLTLRESNLASRVYWFNTYFYSSLTNGISARQINYDSVRKWTRDVDLFDKDFVIVPINESAHWYVAIICNLPALRPRADGRNSGAKAHVAQSPKDPSQSSQMLEEVDPEALAISSGEDTEDKVARAARSFSELSVDDPPSRNERFAKSNGSTNLSPQSASRKKGDSDMLDGQLYTSSRLSEPPQHLEDPTEGSATVDEASGQTTFDEHGITGAVIITLDSLGNSHSPSARHLKEYIVAEARDKHNGLSLELGSIKALNAKRIPLQENFCDCGLYLLGYIAKMMEDPYKFARAVSQRRYDGNLDWSRLQPKRMRAELCAQILDLHAEQEAAREDEKKRFSPPRRASQNSSEATLPSSPPVLDFSHGHASMTASSPSATSTSQAGAKSITKPAAGLEQHSTSVKLEHSRAATAVEHRPVDSAVTASAAESSRSVVFVPDSQEAQDPDVQTGRAISPPASKHDLAHGDHKGASLDTPKQNENLKSRETLSAKTRKVLDDAMREESTAKARRRNRRSSRSAREVIDVDAD